MLIATKDDTVAPVNMDLLVEAFVLHLRINLGTSVGLPVFHSRSMSLERFLDHFLNGALLRVRPLVTGREPSIVVREETTLDLSLEDVKTLRSKACVVLDTLEEEPDRIARVVSGSITTAEKVGDHAVLQHASKRKNVFLSVIETASAKKKATEGDEHISTPASGPFNSEMRKASGQGRNQLVGPQGCRLDVADLLNTDHS